MSPSDPPPVGDLAAAQKAADRIRFLREELASEPVQAVLALTPQQQARFEEWTQARLASLAQQFDVDTTASQKRVSWAMRIASTLGALALSAGVILFFTRYWGYLNTPVQVTTVILTPLVLLAATEFAARRERAKYFTGLLALVTMASFIMNLAVIGDIFNISSTERALAVWGTFAMLLAYRYGLRLLLAIGLVLLLTYLAAFYSARMGYRWLDFFDRPEHFLLLGFLLFALPGWLNHRRHTDFPPVYRLVGAFAFFVAALSLAEFDAKSYLWWTDTNIQRFYGIFGALASAGAIWWGILRSQRGIVNTGSAFFVIFLLTRLYHWWWNWMPRYLFFVLIGVLGIGLVVAFKRIRGGAGHLENKAAA